APAIVSSVKIENEKAIVTLNSEQKSKAIGKSGINIRLAGMLSGYEIELNEVNARTTSNTLSNEEALKNLQDLFKI
ncbi:KH domain-containing protein, partial [Campylobacter coli]